MVRHAVLRNTLVWGIKGPKQGKTVDISYNMHDVYIYNIHSMCVCVYTKYILHIHVIVHVLGLPMDATTK
jgi:hypothetical protein